MTREQILGCLVILSGVFAACILIVGSRDAQVITALLIVLAVLLSIPSGRRWVRRIEKKSEAQGIRIAAEIIDPLLNPQPFDATDRL